MLPKNRRSNDPEPPNEGGFTIPFSRHMRYCDRRGRRTPLDPLLLFKSAAFFRCKQSSYPKRFHENMKHRSTHTSHWNLTAFLWNRNHMRYVVGPCHSASWDADLVNHGSVGWLRLAAYSPKQSTGWHTMIFEDRIIQKEVIHLHMASTCMVGDPSLAVFDYWFGPIPLKSSMHNPLYSWATLSQVTHHKQFGQLTWLLFVLDHDWPSWSSSTWEVLIVVPPTANILQRHGWDGMGGGEGEKMQHLKHLQHGNFGGAWSCWFLEFPLDVMN